MTVKHHVGKFGIALTHLTPISHNNTTKRPIRIMTLLTGGIVKSILIYHDDVVEVL